MARKKEREGRIDREKNRDEREEEQGRERDRTERIVRIIGARRESCRKQRRPGRRLPSAKFPAKLRFHLQIKIHVVRCERTGRREEFDEAFSRYLSLPVNANKNRLPFIALLSSTYIPPIPDQLVRLTALKSSGSLKKHLHKHKLYRTINVNSYRIATLFKFIGKKVLKITLLTESLNF